MVIHFFDTYLHTYIYLYYWCFTDIKGHLKTIIAYYSNSVRNIQTIHICDIDHKKLLITVIYSYLYSMAIDKY